MKVIITGSTGMVGKAILLECLEDSRISEVLMINRRSLEISHPKLGELIHKDFSNINAISNELKAYDACFFAMGVSAAGKSENDYNQLTFEVAAHWADVLHNNNPNITFNYVSGQGSDSTEKGNSMWARIKGKTENYILQKGFKDAYMFRPGLIIPEKGIKSQIKWYNTLYIVVSPLFPLLKRLKSISTTTQVGKAMINTLFIKQDLKYLENADINTLSQ